jgi:hypothetical protein
MHDRGRAGGHPNHRPNLPAASARLAAPLCVAIASALSCGRTDPSPPAPLSSPPAASARAVASEAADGSRDAPLEAATTLDGSTGAAGAAEAGDSGDAGDAGDAGEASADAGPDPACPSEMARIGKLCVDRWEAHLVSRSEDGGTIAHPHNERPDKGVAYEARSAPGVFPQGYVSRVEAEGACKNAGKRLCALREWLRACQGRAGKLFPYGHHPRAGRCNSGKPHLLAQLFGTEGRAWKYEEHFNNPRLLQEPGYLERAGEREGCASEDGVRDLVGNLHEWVRDSVDAELVHKLEMEPVERRKQPWREGNGIFVGGFFSTTTELGAGCKYITIAHEPSYHDYSTGFRCCRAARKPSGEQRDAGGGGGR